MKNLSFLALCAAVAVAAAVVVSEAPAAEAVSCNAMELSSCLTAITYGTAPSAQCCSNLNQQKPCLCQYLKDPTLGQYVNSPNAKKVASQCHVTYPKC